jgi:enoyl-CoA hydratase
MATELRRPAVRFKEHGGVFHVAMERPPANALGAPLVEGLEGALDALEDSPAKVVVISSTLGGFFAAGADIKHMSSLGVEDFERYRDAVRSPLERLACCGRPAIPPLDGLPHGGRRSPRSTGSPSAAGSSLRWRARCGSPRRSPGWACPRSSSG